MANWLQYIKNMVIHGLTPFYCYLVSNWFLEYYLLFLFLYDVGHMDTFFVNNFSLNIYVKWDIHDEVLLTEIKGMTVLLIGCIYSFFKDIFPFFATKKKRI